MRSAIILLASCCLYVPIYVLTSAVLGQEGLARALSHTIEHPRVLVQPGLEGNTAIQIQSIIATTCIVFCSISAVYLIGFRRELKSNLEGKLESILRIFGRVIYSIAPLHLSLLALLFFISLCFEGDYIFGALALLLSILFSIRFFILSSGAYSKYSPMLDLRIRFKFIFWPISICLIAYPICLAFISLHPFFLDFVLLGMVIIPLVMFFVYVDFEILVMRFRLRIV